MRSIPHPRFSVAAIALAAAVPGCGSTSGPPAMMGEDLSLPKGFLFGTAIAGFQVEMGCPTIAAAECEDRNSDWYQFITDPSLTGDAGLHIHGDPPSSGPGFYELYPQDLDRAQNELKNNALRLSIEWSRVFPKTTVGAETNAAIQKLADPKALAYYHKVFAAMKQRGLTPLVTIDHYTLPTWISDAAGCHKDFANCHPRGWVDKDVTEHEIAKYAGFLGREFGADVDLWATLNEPLTAVILPAYLFQSDQRTNPPGVALQFDAAKTALTGEIEAHARMYDAVKANDTVDADGDGKPARVGLVYNMESVTPQNADDPTDQTGAKNATYLLNQVFVDAVTSGSFDGDLSGKPTHRDDLANRLDFLGINYYARLTVQGAQTTVLPKLSSLLTFNPLTLEYDYNYPQGIHDVLVFAKRWNIPLLISETGSDDAMDSGVSAAWLTRTLTWVSRAIKEGIPVEGYFYWSLMDNYEWNHGMTFHLGMYAVDGKDPMKTRKARSGVAAYAAIATASKVTDELAAKYPAPRN